MLNVDNLSKSYATKNRRDNQNQSDMSYALQHVSFSIERGEVVALLGANGSGKTTTVNAICRLIEWDEGSISLDGNDIRQSSSYLRHIGAVLGGCRNTNWRLTAKQNAYYFAQMRGAKRREIKHAVDALHTQLGLDPHGEKEVMKLSTGNKQKSALLAALSYSPEYVLLDEPTLGLDFTTVEQLQMVIKERAKHANQGFLITSHDLDFIENICQKVIVLEQGRLLFEGSIEQLKAKLFHYEMRVDVPPSADAIAIKNTWQGRFNINESDAAWHIQFDEPSQALPMLAFLHEKKLDPGQLQVQPLSIEKAYQTLIKEQRA